jgi:O-antigen/teichoic acid export membrane protein
MLKRDISFTFAGSALQMLVVLATTALVARLLGPTGQGLLALAILAPTIAITFARLGQETVNVIYGGLYKEKRPALFLQSMLLIVPTSIVSILVLLAFYFWLPVERGNFAKLSPTAIYASCLLVPAGLLLAMTTGLVRGLGKVRTNVVLTLVQCLVNLLLAVLLVAVLKMGLIGAILATILATLLGGLAALWVLREVATFNPASLDKGFWLRSLRYGLWVAGADFAGFLVYRVDQVMLAFYVPSAQQGLYFISASMAERLRMLPTSIASAFLPRLSNQWQERRGQVPLVFRYSLVASLLAVILGCLVGPPAILVVFGWKYFGSILPFLILAPGIVLMSTSSILSSAILALGRPNYNMLTGWLTAVANIALNLILMPRIGIVGAAIASTICYAGDCLCGIIFYRRLTKIPLAELAPRLGDVRAVTRIAWEMARQGLRRLRGPSIGGGGGLADNQSDHPAGGPT